MEQRKESKETKERKERKVENWELFSVKVPGLYIMTYKWRFSNPFSVASYSAAVRYDTIKTTIILILTTSRIWNLIYLGMWPSASHLPNPYEGLSCPGPVQFDRWVGAQMYMPQHLLRSVAYRRGVFGVFKPPPQNSEVLTKSNQIANWAENV
jgi:hypothetical protein